MSRSHRDLVLGQLLRRELAACMPDRGTAGGDKDQTMGAWRFSLVFAALAAVAAIAISLYFHLGDGGGNRFERHARELMCHGIDALAFGVVVGIVPLCLLAKLARLCPDPARAVRIAYGSIVLLVAGLTPLALYGIGMLMTAAALPARLEAAALLQQSIELRHQADPAFDQQRALALEFKPYVFSRILDVGVPDQYRSEDAWRSFVAAGQAEGWPPGTEEEHLTWVGRR